MNSQISIEEALSSQPNAPEATSRGRGWPHVTIDRHTAMRGIDLDLLARDHHVLFVTQSTRGRLLQERAGLHYRSVLAPGTVILMPAGLSSHWQGDQPATIKVRIPTSSLKAAADEISDGGGNQFELLNSFSDNDVFIQRICMMLGAELDEPEHSVQSLVVSGLSTALFGHLLRRYNALGEKSVYRSDGLSHAALVRVIDYIEAAIDKPFKVADLAAVAGVSRFHFARKLKVSTGLAPVAYVERIRFQRAEVLLRTTRLSQAEIALEAGFSDQSYFIRRFRRHFGCTPARYARAKR